MSFYIQERDMSSTLDSIIYYFSITTSSFILIVGTVGNSLNIIIFLSLKTFRKNPCAFCLLVLSVSDNGMLLFSTIPNILNNISRHYSGRSALFTCKLSMCFGQTFALLSHCLMCYAAIDQCISTSMSERFKGMTIRLIRRLILLSILLCILHGIPFLLYFDAQTLPGTNTTTCRPTDNDGAFSKYTIYVAFPIIGGLLPILIMTVFALIALQNVRKMTRRRTHIIRLRLEKQLTAMVLIKIFSVCFTIVPFFLVYIIRYLITSHNDNPLVQKAFMLVTRISTCLLFINYAVSQTRHLLEDIPMLRFFCRIIFISSFYPRLVFVDN